MLPTTELSDHVTALLVVPFTVAVKVCVPPGARVIEPGLRLTVTNAAVTAVTVLLIGERFPIASNAQTAYE